MALSFFTNFTWAGLEQFHKTLGHEYVLHHVIVPHHVMQLPDGYAAKVAKMLEETIFWVKDEDKNKCKP